MQKSAWFRISIYIRMHLSLSCEQKEDAPLQREKERERKTMRGDAPRERERIDGRGQGWPLSLTRLALAYAAVADAAAAAESQPVYKEPRLESLSRQREIRACRIFFAHPQLIFESRRGSYIFFSQLSDWCRVHWTTCWTLRLVDCFIAVFGVAYEFKKKKFILRVFFKERPRWKFSRIEAKIEFHRICQTCVSRAQFFSTT